MLSGESLTVTQTAGTYNSANVTSATTVTASLSAGNVTAGTGTLASNYTLPGSASGAGAISPATLTATIIGTPTRPYDGTTNAALTPASFHLSGLASGESFTVAQAAGTYNSANVASATTVTVPLPAGSLTAGTHTLASNYTLPTTAGGAGAISPLPVTAAIIGSPTRPYDGTTNAALAPASFRLSGLLSGQSFTVTQTAGTYNSPNVASATTVTASLSAASFTAGTGTLASNYALPTTASGAGAISPDTVTATIVGNPTKPYDGNASAALAPANFSLAGLVSGQGFTVTQTAGTYNSPNVASATTVTASLPASSFTTGSGTLASNYTLPTTASGAGAITLSSQLPVQVQVSDASGVYTGSAFAASATITPNDGPPGNTLQGIGITLTYYVGTGTGGTNLGSTPPTNAGTYTVVASYPGTAQYLSASAQTSFTITPAPLTASIVGNPTRPYDGTASATLTPANFSLGGLLSGQSFTVTQTAGTYDSANVASATTVTASLSAGNFTAGTGTLASNYTLPTTASGAGAISPDTVTAAIIGNPTRPYDGTANATLTPANFSLAGLVSGQSFTVTQTSGAYNSANVTSASTVTASLSAGNFTAGTGTLASNYTLPTSASGGGAISPATVTASIIGNPSRPYDGTADATLPPASFSLTGLASGESFTVTQTVGTYNSANVTSATTVTASLSAANFTAGTGTLASNYTLPTTASGAGAITPAIVTASIVGNPTKLYDGTANATLTPANFSLPGLVSGQSFTVTQTGG